MAEALPAKWYPDAITVRIREPSKLGMREVAALGMTTQSLTPILLLCHGEEDADGVQ